MREIAGTDDLPDFSNIPIPTIDKTEQAKVDNLMASLELSYQVLAKDMKDVEDARQHLLSWAELASQLVNIVMPIVNKYMQQQNVPAVERGNKWQAALPSLLGVVTLPPEQRAGAISSLLTTLL